MILLATLPDDYLALIGAMQWLGYAVPAGGVEPDDTLRMLYGHCQQMQTAQGWGCWLAVRDQTVVGSIAVKSPVVDGTADIGYGAAPALRNTGVATAMVLGLMPILAGFGVTRVTADTAASNPASARVLTKTGFRQTGQREDPDDGPLILWERLL
jgi:RimJ/RimL family protein N-acetyltransferase